MKALFFDGSLRFEPHAPMPAPGENEALIRVLVAGVCGTDLEIMKGYKNFRGIPGHEFVGVVERVNGPYPDLSGRKVVGEINCGCGACDYCRKGMQKHCGRRSVLGISGRDGVFAEYATLPAANLWEVPAGADEMDMVFVEPLAAAFEVLEQTHVKPTDKVLILGDGKLGLLVALVLRLCGADILLAGRHEEKLAVAAAQNVRTSRVEELTEGRLYDLVVEATGAPQGLDLALDFVKPRGAIVLKSTIAERTSAFLTKAVVDEATIVGSRCGPFGPAVAALASGRINARPLVSAVYPFDDALAAFDAARQPGALKILLDFRTRP